MAIKRWDGAAWVDIANLERWDGAAFTSVADVSRWDGANWVAVSFSGGASDFSVTVSPGAASKIQFTPEPAPNVAELTTNSITATASGGTGPYTYAWTKVSGSSVPQVDSPTSATTTWTGSVFKNSETLTSTWRVTVTDSLSDTATADVSVTLRYFTDL